MSSVDIVNMYFTPILLALFMEFGYSLMDTRQVAKNQKNTQKFLKEQSVNHTENNVPFWSKLDDKYK